MKKILLFIALFVLTISAKAQFPNSTGNGSLSTEIYQKGASGADVGFHLRLSFVDTTAANAYSVPGSAVGFLKNIAGMIIRVADVLYMRSTDLQKWNIFYSAGSSAGGIPDLQTVTNAGNVTTQNLIVSSGFGSLTRQSGSTFEIEKTATGFSHVLNVPTLTGNRTASLQDASGTIAYLSDIVGGSGLTSVGLNMPSPGSPAFSVTNSPLIANGSLNVIANGTSSQYIDGTGALQTTPVLTGQWHTLGNAGTTAGTHFVGTTDNVDLVFKRNSIESGRFSASGNLNLGLTGTTLGNLGLSGNTSGLISIKPQASAGTYNFNLPTTAGTSKYVLTSEGGGSSAMSWQPQTGVLSDSIYGYFINSNFVGSTAIPSGLTSTGGTFTYNAVSGLTMAVTGNNYFSNRIETVSYTTSQNLSQYLDFTITTRDSGIYMGRYSHAAGNKLGYKALLYRTGTSTARIEYHGDLNGIDLGVLASSPNITYSDGQSYKLYVTANTGVIYCQIDRYDTLTNYVLETVAVQYKLKWNGNSALGEAYPNVGSADFGALSGTYRVRSFNQIHYDSRYADMVIMGTSVVTRYSESSLENLFYNIAFQGTNLRVTISGGPGDQLADMRANFATTRLSHPRYVTLEFINDSRGSIRSELPVLIDSIIAIGAIPIILQIFKDVDRDTTVMNICNEKGIPDNRINFGAISETTDFVDLTTHLNDKGGYKAGMLIKSKLPSLIKTKGIERNSLRGMQDVTESLAPTNNSLLQYNSATEQWGDATITSLGTNFVLVSPASPQSGSIDMTGNIRAGSYLRVNSSGIGSARLSLEGNSTGGEASIWGSNANASAASVGPYYSLQQYGVSSGYTPFDNALVLENFTDGGIGYSAYNGGHRFFTGSARSERLTIKATGQLQMPAYGVGTFTGTATKVLQVDASGNIIEGTLGGSSLTQYQIGVGDASNLLSGSSNFTYSGTTVAVNGNIAGTAQTKVLSLNETATGGAVNLAQMNTAQSTARSTMLFSNNSSGDWVNNYALFGVNGATYASNSYFTNISGKSSDAGYTLLVNGGSEQIGMLVGTFPNIPLYLGANNTAVLKMSSSLVGIGQPTYFGDITTTPTAKIHIAAGTSSASTAPLKLTSGTLNTTAEAGTHEYNGTHYLTKASGLRYATEGTIADFYTDVANSGTGETDAYSYTTPANTLGADGEKIFFSYTINLSDITATAQIKVLFAGNTIANTGALTVSSTGAVIVQGWVVRTGSTTARASVNISSPTASTAIYTLQTDLTSLTLSGTNILKLTLTAGGAGGGSGDLTSKQGTVSWKGVAGN